MSASPRTPESRPARVSARSTKARNNVKARLKFAPFTLANPSLQLVTIHVDDGTIWATPNGGAVRGCRGSRVQWACDRKFTLTFTQLGGTREPLGPIESKLQAGTKMWKAEIPALDSGTLPPYYEYTVTTEDGFTLDPIIIVDKR